MIYLQMAGAAATYLTILIQFDSANRLTEKNLDNLFNGSKIIFENQSLP